VAGGATLFVGGDVEGGGLDVGGGGGVVLGGGVGVGAGWTPALQRRGPPAVVALLDTVQPPLVRALRNSVGTTLLVRSELG